jgi:hypothetical protein
MTDIDFLRIEHEIAKEVIAEYRAATETVINRLASIAIDGGSMGDFLEAGALRELWEAHHSNSPTSRVLCVTDQQR